MRLYLIRGSSKMLWWQGGRRALGKASRKKSLPLKGFFRLALPDKTQDSQLN